VYGQQLSKVTQLEEKLIADPKENEVRKIFSDRAAAGSAKLKDPAKAYADGKAAVEADLATAKSSGDAAAIKKAEDALAAYPKDQTAAVAAWGKEAGLAARGAPVLRHAQAFPGKDENAQGIARKNFLALVFCLMVGTAALPHILMRYY